MPRAPPPRGPDEAWRRHLPAAVEALASADTLVIFTGSGMSQESGVPMFRGPDGLSEGARPEEVATPEAFERDPAGVWRWYRDRLARHGDAKPHAGHRALSKLQRLYGRATLATQNVDALHERAGSRGVLHLHGRMSHVRCVACGVASELTKKLLRRLPPTCAGCGGVLRPDVVWFGEALPEGALAEASAAAAAAEGVLVVGTSNLVFPAATLPLVAQASGGRLVEVNPSPSALTDSVEVFLQGPAGTVLPELAEALVRARRTRTKT